MITLRIKRSKTRNPTKHGYLLLLAVAILLLVAQSPAFQSGANLSISSDVISAVKELVDHSPQVSNNATSKYPSDHENIPKANTADHDVSTPSHSPTIVFVTASSQNHFRVAKRDILKSLQHWLFGEASQHFDRNFYFKANMTINDVDIPFDVKVIFYDLDYKKKNMVPKEIFLSSFYPYVEYRSFNYQAYPPHVNVSTETFGDYAWKPLIVKQVMKEQRELLQRRYQSSSIPGITPSVAPISLVYWVDAGTVLLGLDTCRKLNRDIEFALEYGLFVPENSPLKRWTHPGTAFHKLIQLDPELYHNQSTLMPSANTILFDATNDAIWENIVTIWSECALDPDCIAPPGSNLQTNHRYDQAVLSCLMAKNGIPAPNRQRRCIRRGTG